jgi:hypothetical protein
MPGSFGEVGINQPTSGTPIPVACFTDSTGNEHQQMIVETQSGTADPVPVGATNPMPVSIAGGTIPAGTDASTFTAGVSQGVSILGVYNDAIADLTPGTMGAMRLSENRQVQVALGASQTDGWTPFAYVAPATPVATVVKSSGGKIGIIIAGNSDTTWTYLKLFDSSSAPTLGTTTANLSIPLPPSGGSNPSLNAGFQFANGIYFAVTGGPSLTDNTAITASKSVVNFGFQ